MPSSIKPCQPGFAPHAPSTSAPRGGEAEVLAELRDSALRNQVYKSYIGQGYYGTLVPPVIQRNILENPGWYTQYTPYQAEIAQGRMEALVNFQTTVADLTGLPLANASLLDEGTAAAEAMTMCVATTRGKKRTFFVDAGCHPQTIAVVKTRAVSQNIEVVVGDALAAELTESLAGVLVQYPTTEGTIHDYAALAQTVHDAGALVVAATDLLALTLLTPPGEWGADIAIGSAQRFGVPMGFGGPHAAFLSTHEKFKRQVPGRIIGVSKDTSGNPAYRLAMQTREQHIRRDKATSNICTAQVLLAIMAGFYAAYHGPEGLRQIARRVRALTTKFASSVTAQGHIVAEGEYFDTVKITLSGITAQELVNRAHGAGCNVRVFNSTTVGVSFDETTTVADVLALLTVFSADGQTPVANDVFVATEVPGLSNAFARTSEFLTHEVFNAYHAEHEMLRYIFRLQGRDLSLTTSMIPLGSCTMKLNATSEMLPVTWAEFGGLHPFAPAEQTRGYEKMFHQLEAWLADITGFHGVSLQPNAGSQGEYAGLLTIMGYHRAHGGGERDVCLIPVSAHGTNPASAVMAGMKVVPVKCDDEGNIDLDDLRVRAEKHSDKLAALMITYPSTHGVFEETVKDVCRVIHDHGGLVYMDGANMNAQVGLCRPAEMGADVCHLNLHKTFCIPHGGGGPGMGPIAVTHALTPYLPNHTEREVGGKDAIGPVSAAPWGSPSILPISWMYIAMMGSEGLTQATRVAILNANYMANRLRGHYDVLYTGANGRVAHEFIIDLRPFKAAGVTVDDVAKRLMDFGFHAPTMSWPVPGTMMIEPTESESLAELDRFCDAMIAIRAEVAEVENGTLPADDNPLVHAPHTAAVVTANEWHHAYSRQRAAYPTDWVARNKFWPAVGRVDNAWGDRNLMCTCPPVDAFFGDE